MVEDQQPQDCGAVRLDWPNLGFRSVLNAYKFQADRVEFGFEMNEHDVL